MICGLISFIYEVFNADGTKLNEIKRGLDEIYKYIRKTDEDYLTNLDELAEKDEDAYKTFCNMFMKLRSNIFMILLLVLETLQLLMCKVGLLLILNFSK